MKGQIVEMLNGIARELAEMKSTFSGVPAEDGGPGSGNFGHEGRPGQVGGSATAEGGGGGGGESKSKSTAKSSGGKIKSGMTIGSSGKGKQLFEVSITPKGETKPVDVYVYAKNRIDASNELITNGYYGKQHSVSSHSSNFLEAKEKNRETPPEPPPASPLQRQIRNMGSQAFFKHHGIENEAEFEKLYKEGRIGDVDYGQIKAELGREKKGMASANNALGRPLTAAEGGNSQKQSQAPRKFKSPQEEKEYYRQEWKGAIDRMQHYGALARRRIRSGLSDDLIKQAQSEYRTAKAQAIEFEKKHDSIP